MTEERRINLVKQVKHEGEQGKISIRNIRHECQHNFKQLKAEGVAEDDLKRAESNLETMTETHIKKLDELVAKKEEEIMTV